MLYSSVINTVKGSYTHTTNRTLGFCNSFWQDTRYPDKSFVFLK